MNLLEEAIIYSTIMHQGKVRKINGSPYILHPLEVAQISVAGAVHAVCHDKLMQTFLLEESRLIAPPGKGDVYSTVGTFLIPAVSHDVWQASVSHKNFDPPDQFQLFWSAAERIWKQLAIHSKRTPRTLTSTDAVQRFCLRH